MAGNSQRRGAMRKAGTKKGMVVGSGGQRRRGLEGKKATPRAEDRPHHPAARRAAGKGKAPAPPGSGGGRGVPGTTETVAGRNAVVEALRASIPVKTLYVADRIDSDDRVREALKIAMGRGLPMLESPRSELDRLSGSAVHQGLVLTLPQYKYAHPDDLLTAAYEAGERPLVVALDGVTDPRNLGAVVRSAAAFGAHGVLVPQRRSAGMSAGAWKTSAGAAARIPVARATNLARALRAYQKAGLFIVGLDSSGETDISGAAALDQPLCLVIGAEDTGMSRIVAQMCDVVGRIRIARSVESLNAGVAAGIALYEIARARGPRYDR